MPTSQVVRLKPATLASLERLRVVLEQNSPAPVNRADALDYAVAVALFDVGSLAAQGFGPRSLASVTPAAQVEARA